MAYTKDIFFRFLLSPSMRIYRHLFLFGVILVIVMNMGYVSNDANHWGKERLWMSLPSLSIFLVMFYANLYWGIPRYLLQNRWGAYSLFVIGLSVVLLVVTIFFQSVMLPDFSDRLKEIGTVRICLTTVCSLLNVGLFSAGVSAVVLLRNWIISDQQIGELQAVTLQSELDLLKGQINPHFLFNMLNNVNVLLKKDAGMARTVLLRLEELLRYQLEDSHKDWVCLEADISFLRDFLQLEKIRRDQFFYNIHSEKETSGIAVHPLLFIPFVENAVKYSQDSEEASYVTIIFRLEESRLLFYCYNTKPAREIRKGKTGGLGLTNIRRRLELLYSGRYVLDIQEKERSYEVRMEIPLD